jgi:hypothetical protein
MSTMVLRLTTLASLTIVALAAACSGSDDPGESDCEVVTCRLYCEHGFATGPDGCAVCECKSAPGDCEPVTCTLYCEDGFTTGADGCEICACA